MTYREYLESYRAKEQEIATLEDELRLKRSGDRRNAGIDGMPKTKEISDPTGRKATRYAAIQERIDRLCRQRDAMRKDIERDMEACLHPRERTVIRMRYFMGSDWSTIAESFSRSQGTVFRWHNRAIARLTQGQHKNNINESK